MCVSRGPVWNRVSQKILEKTVGCIINTNKKRYGVSKLLPGLFQLTEAMYDHAVRRGDQAQVYVAENSVKTYLGVELKEKYDGSELEIFVDVQS